MSEVHANIVVESVNTNITVDNSSIEFTPNDVQLRIFASGQQGAKGYTGSQGIIGYVGSQGPADGYTGSQGATGFIGSMGSLGYTGSQGAGFTGSQGTTGFVGSMGSLGYTGSQGAGFTGSQGSIGYTGSASDPTKIINGTSQVQIPSSGGNVNVIVNNNTTTVFSAGSTDVNVLGLKKFQETTISDSVSGTITPDVSAATIFNYTLTGNVIINSLSNAVTGTSATLILKQDGTGGRILSSTMKFGRGNKVLSVNANAIDVMFVFYDGSTYYATITNNYV